MSDHNLQPIPTRHAIQRAHQRFGIPESQALRWLVKKAREAVLMGEYNGSWYYKNGGVIMTMKGRIIVTIMEPTDERILALANT